MSAGPLPPRAVARSHRFHVERPLASAFVFFEPVGEKLWAEGWQPKFASDADAALHDGSVFTVERPGAQGPVQTIWLITRYAPTEGLIEYRCVFPGERVSRITVHCREAGDQRTEVEVTYRYTSLSPEGDAYVDQMTEPAFREMIDGWDRMIRDYLVRGTPASP